MVIYYRHLDSFTTPISTRLTVNTTAGRLTIPQFGGQITLAGRESKILVTDYQFGNSTLRYSTAEVSSLELLMIRPA